MNDSISYANRQKARRHAARVFSKNILPRIILILMCFLFILPFYWMLTSSIKSDLELRSVPPTLFPHSFVWRNFVDAVSFIPFFLYMRNSLIIAMGCVIGAIFANSVVAYGFSRIDWPGRDVVFYIVVATMFIPFPVILVALFDIYAKVRLVNTFAPLIIPSFVGTAMHIFMMRQYLLGIPKEISLAGYIDGAGEFQIFAMLILPLMKPVIAVVAIFSALGAWNDFLGPLLYIQQESLYPLALGLQFFRNSRHIEYSMLMAASTLVVLPVVVIFLCFQRFFVEGITLGAIKG
jgi:multiple sugar transport system permease protein